MDVESKETLDEVLNRAQSVGIVLIDRLTANLEVVLQRRIDQIIIGFSYLFDGLSVITNITKKEK